jgi:hypothetical protein
MLGVEPGSVGGNKVASSSEGGIGRAVECRDVTRRSITLVWIGRVSVGVIEGVRGFAASARDEKGSNQKGFDVHTHKNPTVSFGGWIQGPLDVLGRHSMGPIRRKDARGQCPRRG